MKFIAFAALLAACGGSGSSTVSSEEAPDAGPPRNVGPEAQSPVEDAAADATGPADASVDVVMVDGAADATADAFVAPVCPGYERIDVPIGSCLYLNGGNCLPFNPDGTPDCRTPYPCSPVGHCGTAAAVAMPLVFYTSPQTPDARRILHVGACPEVCL